MISKLCLSLGMALLMYCTNPLWAQPLSHNQLRVVAQSACEDFKTIATNELTATVTAGIAELTGTELRVEEEPIEFRGRALGLTLSLRSVMLQAMTVQLITPPNQPSRTILTSYRTDAMQNPELQLMLDADCNTQLARQLIYHDNNKATYIQLLSNESLAATDEVEWLNPPLPRLPSLQPARVRVAMVDSGVNYQLPEIANALARDNEGNLIGYDFWEMDGLPYDAHPVQSPFSVQRHGTRTASIVIREAPGIAIVPYRYPRPDMARMKDLIEHASGNGVRIVGMPLGSNRFTDWAAFQKAAEAHPHMLFIASAGNNGRDIDQHGVYPAALEIDNMLVVTSADDFVTPAERTNHGRISVDYMLPAERIAALDYNGTIQQVSGSSYAVSRLIALAARTLNQTPSLTTAQLKKAIERQSVKARTGRYVSTGYIGDPLATPAPFVTIEQPAPDLGTGNRHTLTLDILVLNKQWDTAKITAALQETAAIYHQCDLNVKVNQWLDVQAPVYLQHLSTGNALTLARKVPTDHITVVFADDTAMQVQFDAEAFGQGNTGNRPWMRYSLWITAVTTDTGIALAHELFHIMTNNGSHINVADNLMQETTSPANRSLSAEQCAQAVSYASEAQLLR